MGTDKWESLNDPDWFDVNFIGLRQIHTQFGKRVINVHKKVHKVVSRGNWRELKYKSEDTLWFLSLHTVNTQVVQLYIHPQDENIFHAQNNS